LLHVAPPALQIFSSNAQKPIMAAPASEHNLKNDTTYLEHVEDPKDRINIAFAQNTNAKYILTPRHLITLHK
jgi:predicted nucleic acid-binding protein